MQPAEGESNRSAGKKTMPLRVLFIFKTSKHTPYWYSGPSPPPSDEAFSVLSGKTFMREGRRWATP